MVKRSDLLQYRNHSILESIEFKAFSKSIDTKYDIFLCHSAKDKEEITLLKAYLKHRGYNAYVDWIDDPQLDRSKVNEKTALTLQNRMMNSTKLFFVLSKNSYDSVWMPWELGFFDKKSKENVFIYPIIDNFDSESNGFSGQEYLGLYPVANVGVNKIELNESYMYARR